MYNKEQYKEILDYFNKDLDLVNFEIKSLLFKNNTNQKTALEDDIGLFLFAKSKRLRPLILFLIKDALKIETNNSIVQLAAALELLHSATLIHDDIIDESNLRRQIPTLNFKYNSKMAVISGDYLLSLCLKELSKINEPKIFEYFSENTYQICKGEINQFFNKNRVVSIEKYLEKSKNKTSSLFMAGVKSLLHLINSAKGNMNKIPNDIQKSILDFVLKFSLAFQIYDDIENFQNDFQGKISEKSSSDIENGIYTLPYLYISQQNNSYGIIDLKNKTFDEKLYNKTLNFSKEYLNNILNEALESIKPLKDKYKTTLLQKLVETFKI